MGVALGYHESIAIDTAHARDDRCDTCITKLHQVAIDRRWIPVRLTELLEHLLVRQRLVGSREHTKHRKPRSRRPKATLS